MKMNYFMNFMMKYLMNYVTKDMIQDQEKILQDLRKGETYRFVNVDVYINKKTGKLNYKYIGD